MPKQASQSPCQKIMARSCLGVKQVPKTNTDTQPEIFLGRGGFMKFGHFDKHFVIQGREGFMKFGHFNKHFVKNTRKEGPTGKTFAFFPPRYS